MPDTTPLFGLPYPLGADKVQQGDDDIRALAERLDALMPRGLLASVVLAVDSTVIGNIAWGTDPAKPITIPAGRLINLEWDMIAQTNVTGAGMSLTIQRWPIVGGALGAPVDLPNGQRWWLGANANYRDSWHAQYLDRPPPGVYAYGGTFLGHLANAGFVTQGSLFMVTDIGPAAASSRPGVDVDQPEISPHGDDVE